MLAGVELGGTKCICVLGTGPDDVRDQHVVPTTTPAETLAAIGAIIGGWDYAALGIASFGPIDLDAASASYGCITNTTKPGWQHADLRVLAGDRPCAIDTDVNGAALAEGRWGAARGLDSWAYITIGTGVGVGSISGRRSLRGLGHSEAGHMRIARLAGDNFGGICAFHGDCVEGLASGPAVAARTGRPAPSLTADDPAWIGAAHSIAMLCHNLALTSLPQRILLGGGVAMGQPQLIPLIRAQLIESLAGFATGRAIAATADDYVQLAGLGERAGPLGALALAEDASRLT